MSLLSRLISRNGVIHGCNAYRNSVGPLQAYVPLCDALTGNRATCLTGSTLNQGKPILMSTFRQLSTFQLLDKQMYAFPSLTELIPTHITAYFQMPQIDRAFKLKYFLEHVEDILRIVTKKLATKDVLDLKAVFTPICYSDVVKGIFRCSDVDRHKIELNHPVVTKHLLRARVFKSDADVNVENEDRRTTLEVSLLYYTFNCKNPLMTNISKEEYTLKCYNVTLTRECEGENLGQWIISDLNVCVQHHGNNED